jgi:hypothetical protein
VRSIEDAVARWPETATSVAVRLEGGGSLRVIAPLGLEDLLGMVARHNPQQVPREYFARRLSEKRIAERWPRATIVMG